MNRPNLFSTSTLQFPNSIGWWPSRRHLPVVLLALGLFVLSPTAQAQLSPPPDGGYPNGNTAEGEGALFSLTTGVNNTAIGTLALANNRGGNQNTATGYLALSGNTNGANNTANGSHALENNTTGTYNTATGLGALYSNTTGNENTANGYAALDNNTTGLANTATGISALQGNTTGNKNTANGSNALLRNTTGKSNTAEGAGALGGNTGSFNTALGFNAGSALTTGSNNIDIDAPGVAGESNTMRIGHGKLTATYILGINGATVPSGVGVIIDSRGHLGTVQSSARFKEAIKPMDKASEAILALEPVTFRYKQELDPDKIPQFGLVAEQVEKVNPDLVVRGEDGKVMTVRYEAVNAMLLNEFLKEHRQVQELKGTVAQQQKQIEALSAGLQNVTGQVESGKPSVRVAISNE